MATPPPALTAAQRSAVSAVLDRARTIGLLGGPPVSEHVEHALAMAACLPAPPRRLLDLGSGAGVPGLVLALVWPEAQVALLDSQHKRVAHLRAAVAELGLEERCVVLHGRAEDLGREEALREAFDVVAARAFGAPAVTAECGAGLVGPGGTLLVSEPPEEEGRWPEEPLATLGLGPAQGCRQGGARFVLMTKVAPLGPSWPRRAGVPAKAPLWS